MFVVWPSITRLIIFAALLTTSANYSNIGTMMGITRPLLITDIPSEALVHVLHYCNYKAIIQFSMTCKKSHETVRQSVSLQLHIELEINGLEIINRSSNTSGDYSTILAELKGYRDAWCSLKFDSVVQQRVLSNIQGMEWDIKNGAYIGRLQGDNGFDRIQIIHLCSPTAPAPLDPKKRFDDFMVDVGQDLVVLIEYIEERSGS
ncbi:unnamed protein product [Rhizoctonia solani]|uniref:F-box domain-containing protein n=1 Tax=Rhizoctonia solani TaxID=456999 RepID=A0A8H3ALY1_9AGAM|nr:unnamed protein product [Rhizoctonia solani]